MEFEVYLPNSTVPDERTKEKANSGQLRFEPRQTAKIEGEFAMEQPVSDGTNHISYFEYRRLRQVLASPGMASEEPFSTFYCPLTGDIMKDPVMTSSNQTYDRHAIQHWFDEGHLTDPCTNQTLVDTSLTSNRHFQQTINEWRERKCLGQILKAKDSLKCPDEAERLQVLQELSSTCEKMPCAKDWISFEGLVPEVIECLKFRSYDVKGKTFTLLQMLVTDHEDNKKAVTVGGCLELATGSLLREPPVLQAAEFLRELAKSQVVRMQLAQQVVALVACVLTVKDGAVKQIVRFILEQLSDTDEIVKKMAQLNWYPPLLERLSKGGEESKVAMMGALADMILSKENIEYLVSHDLISVLAGMLQSGNKKLGDSAMQALKNLSSHEITLSRLVEEGLFPFILESFSANTSDTSKAAAAAILENVTLNLGKQYLLQLCVQTGISKLVYDLLQLLGDLTLRVSAVSLHAPLLNVLYEMASAPDALELGQLIRDEQGCMEVLLTLLKPKFPEVCVRALKLLSVLCGGKGGSAMASLLVKNSRPLIELLEDDMVSSEIHYAAAEILANLPENYSTERDSVVSLNALSNLVKMARLCSEEGKAHAVGALLRYTEAEAKLQHFLVDLDFLSSLVEMLSMSSSLLRSRAALALKNFSLTSPQALNGPKRQFWGVQNLRKVCPVHNMRCAVKKNFCILQAGAVPKLVAMLDDPSSNVAETALDALSTFFQTPNMSANGAWLLHDLKAVGKLLQLALGNSVICSDKSLELLRKIFTVPEIKNRFASEARVILLSLTGCQQSQSLSRKAVELLSELELC